MNRANHAKIPATIGQYESSSSSSGSTGITGVVVIFGGDKVVGEMLIKRFMLQISQELSPSISLVMFVLIFPFVRIVGHEKRGERFLFGCHLVLFQVLFKVT